MFFNKKNKQRIVFFLFYTGFALIASDRSTEAQQGQMESVEHESGIYYTVKKGDTLWGISRQFNDTPWQWPDLWNENQQVPNPHWIYPGDRIRLYHGEGREEYTNRQPEVIMEPISSPPRKGAFLLYPSINMAGFIRKTPVTPSGTIFKARDDKKLLSIGDTIYINPVPVGSDTSEFIPGKKYIIFKMIAPTNERKSKQKIGTQHYLLGLAEIISKESEFAVARISYSIRAIQLGDHIMPYDVKSPALEVNDPTENIDGKIIISEEHQYLIGDNMVAFIDKGEDNQITVGQQYSLYEQEVATIASKKQVTLPPVDIGSLIVIHTEKTNSTVLITNCVKYFTPGTKFRTPVAEDLND